MLTCYHGLAIGPPLPVLDTIPSLILQPRPPTNATKPQGVRSKDTGQLLAIKASPNVCVWEMHTAAA